MLKVLLNEDVACPVCKTVVLKDTMRWIAKHTDDAEYLYIKCKQKDENGEQCKGYIEVLEKDHQVFL